MRDVTKAWDWVANLLSRMGVGGSAKARQARKGDDYGQRLVDGFGLGK
jgi:phage-related protein